MKGTVVTVLALAQAGCTSVLGLGADEVVVRLEDAELVLRNERSSAIHYAALGENSLVLFAPCVRADCPRIEAGATLRVPLAEVPAGVGSERVNVHWWERRIGAGGEPVPGPVHTIRLRR